MPWSLVTSNNVVSSISSATFLHRTAKTQPKKKAVREIAFVDPYFSNGVVNLALFLWHLLVVRAVSMTDMVDAEEMTDEHTPVAR